MKVTYHARTDPGQVREFNEDSMVVVEPKREDVKRRRGDLLLIADGMGGHQAGEIASRQAIETIVESYYQNPNSPQAALQVAIQDANAAIFRRSRNENRQGMGTTVVAAAIVEDRLFVAHVGDSRIYLIREGLIRPLTQDHSFVAEQVAAGIITPEEAERHPNRNVISRAVGTTPRVEVELSNLTPLTLKHGDYIVLCSDGLTEYMRPEQILALVRNQAPDAATQALINAANRAGGSDNISVIVARVGDTPSPEVVTAAMTSIPSNVTAPQRAIRPPLPSPTQTLPSEAPTAPLASTRERIQTTRATRVREEGKGCAGTAGSGVIGLVGGLILGGAIFLALNNFIASDVNPIATPTNGADLPAVQPTTTLAEVVSPTLTLPASTEPATPTLAPIPSSTPATPASP